MNANLLVRINAVLNRISRSYSQLPALLFFLFMTIGYHASADDQIIIKITDPAPVCFPQTVDLTLSSITAGSTPGLVFTYYSDPDLKNVIATPNAVGNGIYYILGKIPLPGYGQASSYINVTVNTLPTANISYAGNPFCSDNLSSQPVTLTGTGLYTGGVFSSSGLTIDSSSGAIIPSSSAIGSHTVSYAIDASGGCPAVTVTTAISIFASPTTSNAGTSKNLCSATETTLEGNVPVVGAGIWTIVSGPNTPAFSDASLNNTTVTGLVVGVYVFQWSISNGSCAPSTSTVTVTNTAAPTTSNAGPAQDICNVTSVVLSANVPVIGVGTWTLLSGPNVPFFTNAFQNNTTVTGIIPGVYVFQWSITNGTCISTSSVTVTNSGVPTPSVAGSAQNICGKLESEVLGGNTPIVGIGAWSIVSGGAGSFSSPDSGNSTFTAGAYGTYVLRWTITNGICLSSASDVTINFYPAATIATVGSAQNNCGVLISGALGGNTPLIGTGAWSIVSGGTGTFSSATTGNSTFTASAYGKYVLRWTISSSSICISTADVNIDFYEAPTTSIVGPNQNICGKLESDALGGNTPIVGTGTWSIISGGTGTFSSSGSGNSTFIAGAYGTYVLRWTIINATCAASTADITVNFSETPTIATVGPAQNICGVLISEALGGNTALVGTGTWSIVSGGTGIFSDAGSGSTTFTAGAYGTYVLRWTITNGTCTSGGADVTVSFSNSPSVASAGTPQNICGSLISGALGGNTPVVGIGAWSILSGGTGTFSASGTGNSTFTADASGAYILRWTINNGACLSTADITVLFNQTPTTASAGATQNICGTLESAGLGGNTPTAGAGTWTIVSGGTGIFSAVSSGNSIFTAGSFGTYILRWTISNGSCTPSTADVIVNYSPSPSDATVGAPQSFCGAMVSTQLGGNTPNVGTGLWSIESGGTGIFSDATKGSSTFTASAYGTYILRWTISSNLCNSTADVNVDFYEAPTIATVGVTQNICGSLLSADLGGNTPIIGVGTWSIVSGGTGAFSASGSGSSTFTAGGYGTYVLRWTISNGNCTVSIADVNVSFFQSPTTATVWPTLNVCGVLESGSLGGNTPLYGIGSWSIVSGGAGAFSSISNGNSTFTAGAYGTYVLRWTISNGTCIPSSADVTVNFYSTLISIAFTGTNASKAGMLDGTIDATVLGGTLPYNYSWIGAESFTANTEDLTGLKYGKYGLNVVDKNGCMKSDSYIVLDPPAAIDDIANTLEDDPVIFNIVSNDTDADGTVNSSTVDLDPATMGVQKTYTVVDKGVFSVSSTGDITFTSLLNYLGTVTIQYVVSDNDGILSNIANISVNVKARNKPPVAVDDNITVNEDNQANGNLLSNDSDPEGKVLIVESFTIGSTIYTPQTNVTLAGVGTLLINQNGAFAFVPELNFNGIVPQVSYKLVDAEGLTASANLNIVIAPVNDPPVAVADNLDAKENNKLEANILSNDYDIEGDAITIDVVPIQPPAHGALVLLSNGDFTYQPVMDFIGSDSFTYQICDNGNPSLCSIATVSIQVGKDANCDVFVPNVFTPNADGVHDYLKVRCLYNYENPEMQIFNRAGNLVFKKDHYGNLDFWGSEDSAYWNGRSENKWNVINDELPVGTYYYILKLGDGKVLAGFIFLGK